jgi:branched-chain amino acid transport system ATP-binding protein
MSSSAWFECRSLCAWWGSAQILFDLDLELHPGEVVALVGPNGAGKSTTLKALMGLVPKRSGQIFFEGQDLSQAAPYQAAQAGLGVVPEDRRLFGELTVLENLQVGQYKARLVSTFSSATRLRPWTLESVFTLFPQLQHMLHRPAAQMSGGEQQMLTIARTLMGNPRLLLLDEPSEGVAPVLVEQLAHTIKELKSQGLSILLSEQNQEFVDFVSDRQYALHLGQLTR